MSGLGLVLELGLGLVMTVQILIGKLNGKLVQLYQFPGGRL